MLSLLLDGQDVLRRSALASSDSARGVDIKRLGGGDGATFPKKGDQVSIVRCLGDSPR